ncbi:MAG: hypothetical protein ACOYLS_07265 [Polymorphobacter sp.]
MDLDLSPGDTAFRCGLRAFPAAHLSDEIRVGTAASPSVFVEPDVGRPCQALRQQRGAAVAADGAQGRTGR